MYNFKNNHLLRKILGFLLVIVGVVGLFLPFLQGILFIFLGLTLIGGKPLLKKCKKMAERVARFFKK